MASLAYSAWIDAGQPFTLAAPLAKLQKVLQGYGLTVYAYPDESHQQANPPEDHTPYSATGWPVSSPRWYGFAVDIMPGSDGAAGQTRLARQIIADKDSNVPGTEWIKYINWTDEQGRTWHTSWQPYKVTVSSTDKGHIHISGRSDYATANTVAYDPIARMSAGGDDEEMGSQIGPVFLGLEGFTSITVTPVQAGAANPRRAWINVCNDTGGNKYAVRLWYSTGDGNWAPLGKSADGIYQLTSGVVLSIELPQNTRVVSVKRVAPDADTPVYDGSLSVLFEQGPVIH